MKLVAACAFGLEALVKRELIKLGFQAKVEQPGRISFEGDWNSVALANIWLRTADRVLVQVIQFPAADFDALFDTVKDFDWSQLLPIDASFPVTGRSRLSKLTSVPAVQRSVKRAIVESLKREHKTEELTEQGSTYKVDVALLHDVATLTIDTTGPSLHKRGYRKLSGAAPIKETLAAAMIDLSVWNPERVLVDPFCGTGTIPIEAAMIGLNIAPGCNRNFTFSSWSEEAATATDEMRQAAYEAIRDDLTLQIIGTDHDEEALEMARYHARQAGVEGHIHFQQKEFEDLRSEQEYGCVVTNPPYGERLDETEQLMPLYRNIPMVMQRLPTWSLFVLTNMPRFQGIVQKSATRRRRLFNGRIECIYYQYLGPRPPRPGQENTPATDETIADPNSSEVAHDVSSPTSDDDSSNKDAQPQTKPKYINRKTADPIFGGLQDQDRQQAELFKSRLLKRIRHFRRWPTRKNIDCYRLYERDIPEIPLIVDRYGDALHITQYERPHDRDLGRDAAWLQLMKETAAECMEISAEQVFIKHRDRDASQYDKVATVSKVFEVNEGDLRFQVNLSDYVDTGLFLDHRNLRQIVREKANDRDFLNLFAYTGSFSVYAAAGNARSTTTVDLSTRYLDWASENLRLNGFTGSTHGLIPGDTLSFLREAVRNPEQKYDLAVVDPPTYSNSKRTNMDWDVQKQHVELLNLVRQVMRPDGLVFFSTNFRRFKFREEELEGYSIREISKQTVPEDFRNKRIHRCWQLNVI